MPIQIDQSKAIDLAPIGVLAIDIEVFRNERRSHED